MPDVVVVGAGVVGAATAYALTEAGARVTVLDGGQVAGGTSGATFAVDITRVKTPRALFDLSVASAREHTSLQRGGPMDGGGTRPRRSSGAREEDERQRVRDRVRRLRADRGERPDHRRRDGRGPTSRRRPGGELRGPQAGDIAPLRRRAARAAGTPAWSSPPHRPPRGCGPSCPPRTSTCGRTRGTGWCCTRGWSTRGSAGGPGHPGGTPSRGVCWSSARALLVGLAPAAVQSARVGVRPRPRPTAFPSSASCRAWTTVRGRLPQRRAPRAGPRSPGRPGAHRRSPGAPGPVPADAPASRRTGA